MKNRTGLIFAILIAINIAEIFMERISILRYWDELLAVLSLAFLILNSKGKIKIKGFNGTVLCSIFVIFLVAPRMMLLKYGYKTMLKYFPIGGGFASFGSDMAAKYYSKLYYTYGFNLNWGTREGSQYLNDSWWPIVMGQFGVIGLIFVLILLYRLFTILQNRIRIRTCKIAVISALVYMLVASVGTTIFTTSATIILCVNLVLVANAINYEENLDVAK